MSSERHQLPQFISDPLKKWCMENVRVWLLGCAAVQFVSCLCVAVCVCVWSNPLMTFSANLEIDWGEILAKYVLLFYIDREWNLELVTVQQWLVSSSPDSWWFLRDSANTNHNITEKYQKFQSRWFSIEYNILMNLHCKNKILNIKPEIPDENVKLKELYREDGSKKEKNIQIEK